MTLALPLLFLAAAAAPQEPATFGVEVEAVRLDVFASRDGEPLTGLGAADFEVREDGVRQEIDVLTREEAPPLHVVLVLDTSASVAGERLEELKGAAGALLAGLGAGDRATLLTFSHRARRHGPVASDLSSLTGALAAARAEGGTALYDAIYTGLELADPRLGRPIAVVFSDGEDGLSWLSTEQVARAAASSDAVIFAIHARRGELPVDGRPRDWARRRDPTSRFLRRLAADSGGRLWESDRGDLRETFLEVLAQFQSRYLLRYPSRPGPCGRWRKLEVKLVGRRGELRARRGYAAPCDAAPASR